MRTIKILTVMLLSTAATASATEILTTHVRTQALVASAGAPGAPQVFLAFTDQSLEVQARLFVLSTVTVDEHWWRDLSWLLRQDGQPPRVINSADVKLLRSSRTPEPPREILYADFLFPALPVGSYELQASVATPRGKQLSSEIFRFTVRVGSEDRDTRRSYLRFTSDLVAATPAADRYERFRELMLELASLEPDNPGVWERLGDIAASVAPPVETAAYYARALEVAEHNVREKFGANVPRYAQESLDALRQNLTAFSRAVPHVGSGVRIAVSNRHGKKRILLYRERNLIHTID